ncbi:hypothetical protein L596_022453 [Steinernema carpocapsae]|uniref:Protein FMC1 homolog n=1 Tax=Steinernema carpocapsae TaxID=34508 RepID=A0A4U5MM54_STECR|nr:hypothetical protein L596_022453 [Steinernema carpocapsae]
MAAVGRSARLLPLFQRVISDMRKSGAEFAQASKEYQFTVHQIDKVNNGSPLTTPKDDVPHIASTYAVYLESTRELNELQERYKGGERSVEDSAHLVGLELPKKQHF